MNSFAGIFWLVLAQLQNRFFVEHLPVAAYVRCLNKKNERNEIVCFYCTQSDILCGIARFSWGNKNKLRTFQPQKWKKNQNSHPQTKFTGSCIKKECIPKITSANLCISIHDIINYSTSICSFEFGKCGEEGKKSQKIECLENKKSFSDEIKNNCRSF